MSRVWTLNLSDESPFYEQFRYPGGEYQIRLKPDFSKDISGRVRIICRQAHGDGMIKLALLVSALRGLDADITIDLILPYLPYGRADRRFVPGDCYGLKAFARLINSMALDRVLTLDAHSGNAHGLINCLVDVPALPLIYKAIGRFADRYSLNEVTVLFPDKGARSRYALSTANGPVRIKVLHCTKRRHPATGALSGFDVPAVIAKQALIVDDICDGGGTFLGIAGELPAEKQLGLYVTHGIFSKGLETLKQHFDIIYTTDSFQDVSTLDAAVFDSISAILAGAH